MKAQRCELTRSRAGIRVSIVGGLLIGQLWALTPLVGRTQFVVEHLTGTPIGPAFWEKASDILLFVVMSLILLLRPRGLLGPASVREA